MNNFFCYTNKQRDDKLYLFLLLTLLTLKTVTTMLVFLLTMMISPPSTALSAIPGQFRAAVYEHELVNPTNCSSRVCSREEAKALMEINLSVLEKQVVEAAKQGADIILLPEDGKDINGSELRV